MAREQQDSTWLIHPSLWFDALCLIPLLAGLPFYTSRHEQDTRWWQERFSSIAGQHAREGVSVLRHEIADRAVKPLPAFLALWTSPAAASSDGAAECLDGLQWRPYRAAARAVLGRQVPAITLRDPSATAHPGCRPGPRVYGLGRPSFLTTLLPARHAPSLR